MGKIALKISAQIAKLIMKGWLLIKIGLLLVILMASNL